MTSARCSSSPTSTLGRCSCRRRRRRGLPSRGRRGRRIAVPHPRPPPRGGRGSEGPNGSARRLPDGDLLAGFLGVAEGGESGHLHDLRSEEHTSELQSLMRISYAVFCWKKKSNHTTH